MGGGFHRRPSLPLVLSVVAVGIAVGGVAIGSVPDSKGEITGCYGKKSGKLRVIDTSKRGKAGRCGRGEKKLTWNQKGPAGPPGANGANGAPAAADGPGGHVAIRFVDFMSSGAGQSGHVHVTCDPGETAIGGGIGWTMSPGSGDAIMYSGPQDADAGTNTFPAQGAAPVGWAGEIKTSDGPGKTGRVYAICAKP